MRRVFDAGDGLKLSHRFAVQRGQIAIGYRVTNGRTKPPMWSTGEVQAVGGVYNSTREPGRRGSVCGLRLGSGLPGMG